jgi:UDPglucose 6-dehydrogenase
MSVDRVPARLVVVGSGVVGTASGVGFRAKGHRVVFCDRLKRRVLELRRAGLESLHLDHLVEVETDAYFLSVPTPTVEGKVDLSAIRSAARNVGRALREAADWRLVVVRSTVPPGTTSMHILPILERVSGRSVGADFGLCTNPEFLRERSAEDDFMRSRVIVIGSIDRRSELMLRRLYAPWRGIPVVATDLVTAEATKYTANLFNATKISFFNQLERIFELIGADARAAFKAAALGAEGLWNSTYGTKGLAPYGGACLPKDIEGFVGFAEETGLGELVPILRAAIAINEEVGKPAYTERQLALA